MEGRGKKENFARAAPRREERDKGQEGETYPLSIPSYLKTLATIHIVLNSHPPSPTFLKPVVSTFDKCVQTHLQ